MASLDRLYAVLEERPAIVSPATPRPFTPGEISFEDVAFGYDGMPVLRGLTFTAEAERTTAIVGPSGAGKTTVFALLTRLVDSGTGRVSIGGTDVQAVDIEALRDAIAVVGQETPRFSTRPSPRTSASVA